ncbi:MAG: hypothetical protein AAF135_06425 [Bacteroidota bacterium]
MTSFRSKLYPTSTNRVRVVQESSMQYYAGLNVLIMLYVIAAISTGDFSFNLLWQVVIMEVIAVGLGNMLGRARLHRNYAEIFFVGDHFSLISVYEVVTERKNHAFPMMYASPSMNPEGDQLTFHFNDQVITLRRKDWEEFDLIADYMFARFL